MRTKSISTRVSLETFEKIKQQGNVSDFLKESIQTELKKRELEGQR